MKQTKLFVHTWKMIGLIHIVIGLFHVCYVYRGAANLSERSEANDCATFEIMQCFNIYVRIFNVYIHIFLI